MKLVSGAVQRLAGLAFAGVLLATAAGTTRLGDAITPRERAMLGEAYVATLSLVEDGARALRMAYYDAEAPAPA
jgi:hypothetical protein